MPRIPASVCSLIVGALLFLAGPASAAGLGPVAPADNRLPAAPAAPLAVGTAGAAIPTQWFLAALLAGGGVLAVALGFRARVTRAHLDDRLGLLGPWLDSPTPVRRGVAVLHRSAASLAPAMSWLAQLADRLLPDKQIERIRANLAIAGLPSSRHLTRFLAAKVVLAIGLGFGAGFYQVGVGEAVSRVVLVALAGAVLGFYLPGFWLGRRMSARRRQVVKALPDAIDLLTISVGAGLGFDGAIVEVIQRWQNPLTEEFAAVLRDLKFGTTRRDALRGLALRTGVEDVSNFVAAVVLADELGTPMKEVLQIQAEQMRMQRRHRAEEKARQAVIKMLVPMVLFIFPALFVVLLGPAIPSLSSLMGSGK